MSITVDPKLAKYVYDDACRRLEELEENRIQIIKVGLHTCKIDDMIAKYSEERKVCEYFFK